MSFSSEVKNELFKNLSNDRHCNIAELAAIINLSGRVFKGVVKIQTENALVAKKCFSLLKKTFDINCEVLIRKNNQLKEKHIYFLFVTDRKKAAKLLSAIGFKDNVKYISPLVVSGTCCRRAYIRGAFLSCGSITNPEKTYHLEFVNTDRDHACALMDIVNSFDMDSKITVRKGYFVLYLKEGEQIVNLLNIIGAHVSLMELENVRILKDVRNNVNRIVNCETANLSKTVSASVKNIEDINYIISTAGISYLSKQLQDVANIRLLYPDLSFRELGRMLTPPVSKSGVNHRLKKISEIAKALKGGHYL